MADADTQFDAIDAVGENLDQTNAGITSQLQRQLFGFEFDESRQEDPQYISKVFNLWKGRIPTDILDLVSDLGGGGSNQSHFLIHGDAIVLSIFNKIRLTGGNTTSSLSISSLEVIFYLERTLEKFISSDAKNFTLIFFEDFLSIFCENYIYGEILSLIRRIVMIHFEHNVFHQKNSKFSGNLKIFQNFINDSNWINFIKNVEYAFVLCDDSSILNVGDLLSVEEEDDSESVDPIQFLKLKLKMDYCSIFTLYVTSILRSHVGFLRNLERSGHRLNAFTMSADYGHEKLCINLISMVFNDESIEEIEEEEEHIISSLDEVIYQSISDILDIPDDSSSTEFLMQSLFLSCFIHTIDLCRNYQLTQFRTDWFEKALLSSKIGQNCEPCEIHEKLSVDTISNIFKLSIFDGSMEDEDLIDYATLFINGLCTVFEANLSKSKLSKIESISDVFDLYTFRRVWLYLTSLSDDVFFMKKMKNTDFKDYVSNELKKGGENHQAFLKFLSDPNEYKEEINYTLEYDLLDDSRDVVSNFLKSKNTMTILPISKHVDNNDELLDLSRQVAVKTLKINPLFTTIDKEEVFDIELMPTMTKRLREMREDRRQRYIAKWRASAKQKGEKTLHSYAESLGTGKLHFPIVKISRDEEKKEKVKNTTKPVKGAAAEIIRKNLEKKLAKNNEADKRTLEILFSKIDRHIAYASDKCGLVDPLVEIIPNLFEICTGPNRKVDIFGNFNYLLSQIHSPEYSLLVFEKIIDSIIDGIIKINPDAMLSVEKKNDQGKKYERIWRNLFIYVKTILRFCLDFVNCEFLRDQLNSCETGIPSPSTSEEKTEKKKKKKKEKSDSKTSEKTSVPKPVEICHKVCKLLQLLSLETTAKNVYKELKIEPQSTSINPVFTQLGRDEALFQLWWLSNELDRPVGKVDDPRVKFRPDDWQRKLLDIVDRRESAIVAAPTSSGKTFVAFYAMEKVLRTSHDDVVIYVAPTRALVYQVEAEIYSRFSSKKYPNPKKVLQGRFLKNLPKDAFKCQVLVVEATALETVLLNFKNLDWTNRLKYVIFDEVHCVGEREGGMIWERCLQLIRCPFLALSATVSNTREFHNWLETVTKYKAMEDSTESIYSPIVHLVEESERYSDLHLYNFSDNSNNVDLLPIHGLSCVSFSQLYEASCSSSDLESLNFVNFTPVEAVEVYFILKYIVKLHLKKSPDSTISIPDELKPKTFFFSCRKPSISKRLFRSWEKEIKKVFLQFIRENVIDSDMYENVILKSLSNRPALDDFYNQRVSFEHFSQNSYNKLISSRIKQNGKIPESPKTTNEVNSEFESVSKQLSNLSNEISTTSKSQRNYLDPSLFVSKLKYLNKHDLMPLLIFNMSPAICEKIAITTSEHLAQSQYIKYHGDEQRSNKTKAENRRRLNKWKAECDRILMMDKKSRKADDFDETEVAELLPPKPEEVEDEYDPDWNFSNITTGEEDTIEFVINRAKYKTDERLIKALRRGIGVHHSGLNAKYRRTVEILFRLGFLRVVVSTETLSLGINMPCRSVLFAGDAINLNDLLYRQMSGRSGRRGFDLCGYVLFCDFPFEKIKRLVGSELTELKGDFSYTPLILFRSIVNQAYYRRAISIIAENLKECGSVDSRQFVNNPSLCPPSLISHVLKNFTNYSKHPVDPEQIAISFANGGTNVHRPKILFQEKKSEEKAFSRAIECLVQNTLFASSVSSDSPQATSLKTAQKFANELLVRRGLISPTGPYDLHGLGQFICYLFELETPSCLILNDLCLKNVLNNYLILCEKYFIDELKITTTKQQIHTLTGQNLMNTIEYKLLEILSSFCLLFPLFSSSSPSSSGTIDEELAKLNILENTSEMKTTTTTLRSANSPYISLSKQNDLPVTSDEHKSAKGANILRRQIREIITAYSADVVEVARLSVHEYFDKIENNISSRKKSIIYDNLSLPLSKIDFNTNSTETSPTISTVTECVKSPFTSLSGDKHLAWSKSSIESSYSEKLKNSLEDLTNGFYMDYSNFPVIDVPIELKTNHKMKYSSYLLDFFHHGSLHTLSSEHRMSESTAFDLIRRWDDFLDLLNVALNPEVNDLKARGFEQCNQSYYSGLSNLEGKPIIALAVAKAYDRIHRLFFGAKA